MDNIFGAGIVSYNPDIERLEQNINSIYYQVGIIVLVDNYSNNRVEVKSISEKYDRVVYIQNDDNLGVGAALNQIVSTLDSNGYEWALLMDQDSIADGKLIIKYSEYINNDTVALVSPFIVDVNKTTFEEYKRMVDSMAPINKISFAITSGSCISIHIYKIIGAFDESLFIDGIDTDYSRRLMICGFDQIRVNNSYILHEVGKARKSKIVRLAKNEKGNIVFQNHYRTNHSALRVYYMTRNNIIITRRYSKYINPIKKYAFIFCYMFGKLLVENNRRDLLKAIIQGIRDGFRFPVSKFTKPISFDR